MPTTDGASNRAKLNVAARMGRWSARHRKAAILGWLGFVAAAFILGGLVGTKQLSDPDTLSGQSQRAAKIVAGARLDAGDPESVLVQSRTRVARSPEFRSAVEAVLRKLATAPGVDEVRSPYAQRNGGKISADGHSALVRFRFGPSSDGSGASVSIERVLKAVDEVARGHPGFFIGEFGDASAQKARDDSQGRDFRRAELLSIPLSAAILLITFGALIAAGIPVLLALTAVLAAFGLLAFPSHSFTAPTEATATGPSG